MVCFSSYASIEVVSYINRARENLKMVKQSHMIICVGSSCCWTAYLYRTVYKNTTPTWCKEMQLPTCTCLFVIVCSKNKPSFVIQHPWKLKLSRSLFTNVTISLMSEERITSRCWTISQTFVTSEGEFFLLEFESN